MASLASSDAKYVVSHSSENPTASAARVGLTTLLILFELHADGQDFLSLSHESNTPTLFGNL